MGNLALHGLGPLSLRTLRTMLPFSTDGREEAKAVLNQSKSTIKKTTQVDFALRAKAVAFATIPSPSIRAMLMSVVKFTRRTLRG
ncbi:hypothetical protein AVEN_234027-1 [Araneus ventricosus]|uniref:Uncharacterized protein n=1 Tax=Araneus ventricosus TaxID=182803 RepID=A0A4Y2S4X0_ARAVE|nr:hypothetical protein AVEN_234027-1 [Araneus ventricosus]